MSGRRREEHKEGKRKEREEEEKKERRKEERKRRRGGKHGTWIEWWTVGGGRRPSMMRRYLPPHAQRTEWLSSSEALPGWGPRQHTTPTPTPSLVVLIPPAREGGPPRGGGAGLGGGRLRNCACCGGQSHRWGNEPKRAIAGQQGAAEGKDGGRGVGGTRRSVSRPYEGACDQPRVAQVARAACLGRVAEP